MMSWKTSGSWTPGQMTCERPVQDRDQDGFLDMEELRSWESGQFHTEGAMKRFLRRDITSIRQRVRIADGDGDGAVTAGELEAAQDRLRVRDAHFYLTEWAAHHEL